MMPVTRSNLNFRLKQIVKYPDYMRPYVGFENVDKKPNGFRFDVKRWSSTFDLKLPTMPRTVDPSIQGVKESEYFKPGVLSVADGDLIVKNIDDVIINHENKWIPTIQNGWYARYHTKFFLFSDNSRIQYVNPTENVDGRNFIELEAFPELTSPIIAATYHRSPYTKRISYKTFVKQVSSFTGIEDSGEELETVSPVGNIYWDNVDITKREFLTDIWHAGTVLLHFNKDYTQQIGIFEPETITDLCVCEFLGTGTSYPYQTYYLENFPVREDNLDDYYHRVFITTGESTWEEWDPLDSWWELFSIDNDGDSVYTGEDKVYYLDKDLGIIYFGTGFNGATPGLGRSIYIAYTTTLRVEYEELGKSKTILARDADVNPITQTVNQGFVCVSHDLIQAATISLKIDKPPIAGTNPIIYGPMSLGADYSLLMATVKSISGEPIPASEVKFKVSRDFVGLSSEYGVTDEDGIAYTSAYPPGNTDVLGFYTTDVVHASGSAIVTINDPTASIEGESQNLYIYKILKDDVLAGYEDLDEYVQAIYDDPDFEKPAWVVAGGSEALARWKAEFILMYDLKDWLGIQEGGRITGRNVIIYEFDADAINPQAYTIPGATETGAYVPIRPTLITKTSTGYELIYPVDAIPVPDPDDPNNPVGGYLVICPRVVKFRASCWSPYYNRTIYSNELNVRLTLPPYLLGEYMNSDNEKIPFGWKLPSDNDSVAAGINGATFITINPTYRDMDGFMINGPYEVQDLVGETGGTGLWASSPFNSISFSVEVLG